LPADSVLAKEAKEEMVIREEKGLRFKLPADWPIEERDGVVAPILVEDYLSRKFSVLNTKFESVEVRIDSLEKRLAALEQEDKEFKKPLSSGGGEKQAKAP